MKPVLLISLFVMSCVFAPRAQVQQAAQEPTDASRLSARLQDLEKTVKTQTQRIHKLEQDLKTRDEDVHMLVRLVSKQLDSDSRDSDEGSASSSDCDANPVARVQRVHKTHFKAPSPVQR